MINAGTTMAFGEFLAETKGSPATLPIVVIDSNSGTAKVIEIEADLMSIKLTIDSWFTERCPDDIDERDLVDAIQCIRTQAENRKLAKVTRKAAQAWMDDHGCDYEGKGDK